MHAAQDVLALAPTSLPADAMGDLANTRKEVIRTASTGH
jgi:hypothetical protein